MNKHVNFLSFTRDKENRRFARLNWYPDLYENPTKVRFINHHWNPFLSPPILSLKKPLDQRSCFPGGN